MTFVRPDRDRDDLGAAVAARLDRQAILYDETKRFEFLLAEGALRWRLGALGSHLAQLDRLVAVSTLPNVDLAVLPQTAPVPAWHGHGFVIFTASTLLMTARPAAKPGAVPPPSALLHRT